MCQHLFMSGLALILIMIRYSSDSSPPQWSFTFQLLRAGGGLALQQPFWSFLAPRVVEN